MRRPRTPGLVLALLLAVSVARADSTIDLNWNDCDLGSPSSVVYFGCTTNFGASNVVVSFVAPPGITALGSVTVKLLIEVPMLPVLTRDLANRVEGPYPAWWEFGVGACREGAVQIVQPPTSSPCPDPWSGHDATGVLTSFAAPSGSSGPVRELTATITPVDAGAYALDGGAEYAILCVRVSHDHTTGLGECAGCLQPMWIFLEEVDLQLKDGSPTVVLTQLAHPNGLGWQGDAPVPTHDRTWGSLKARYR